MQDEVNEKTVALSIKAAKLTAAMLQAAIKKLLAEGKKQLDKQTLPKKGKQSLKQLMKHSTGVSNIEITDENMVFCKALGIVIAEKYCSPCFSVHTFSIKRRKEFSTA